MKITADRRCHSFDLPDIFSGRGVACLMEIPRQLQIEQEPRFHADPEGKGTSKARVRLTSLFLRPVRCLLPGQRIYCGLDADSVLIGSCAAHGDRADDPAVLDQRDPTLDQ